MQVQSHRKKCSSSSQSNSTTLHPKDIATLRISSLLKRQSHSFPSTYKYVQIAPTNCPFPIITISHLFIKKILSEKKKEQMHGLCFFAVPGVPSQPMVCLWLQASPVHSHCFGKGRQRPPGSLTQCMLHSVAFLQFKCYFKFLLPLASQMSLSPNGPSTSLFVPFCFVPWTPLALCMPSSWCF